MMEYEKTPLESFIEHKAQTGMQCGNYSIDIDKPKAGEQYRFHFDATACIGCHCCEVACNEQNNNGADVKWRRVAETQSGIFPNVKNHFNSMSCNHCLDPECLKGCPTNSYIKLDNGIVFHEDESCIGCQYCTWNCPYEVPVFNKDRGIVTKCHMCHEKLAVGQTPACVQACPSGAIAIEIVNVNEWLNEGLKKEGIAPNLPDIEITKPTTRYTIDETADMTPADEHIVKPNHSEWPLVFMTVLTQISFGGFVAAFLGESANLFGFNLPTPNFAMMTIIFLLSAIALPLSALHLGKPLKALSAMKNIKTSWLSKEALWLGVYTLGSFLVALLYFFEFGQFFKFLVEIATFGAGAYGIYAQSMIYRIKARPSWNKKETTNIFFNVGYIGVLLVGAILIVSENYQSAFIVVPFGAFIGFLQYSILKKEVEFYTNLEENEKNFYQLNKTKKLYENNFVKLRDYRERTLVVGAFILPILSLLLLASQNFNASLTMLILAVIISFTSEIISRLLFYKTAVSLGIAGNFFMGNQRG